MHGESAKHVHVGVRQALALDHRPVFVEVLYQVIAPVQVDGPLVLDAAAACGSLLQAPAFS